MEEIEKINKIRERILRTYPYIHATDVPVPTYEAFNKLAKEEFCDHFGLTIKYLMDIHNGILLKGTEHLEEAILDLNERLKKIESRFEEKKKPKTRLDGTGGKEDGK